MTKASIAALLAALMFVASTFRVAAHSGDLPEHHSNGEGGSAPVALSIGSDGAVSPASDHAPIGMMGDHRHRPGEWMISYRYMHMEMEGNRNGRDELTPEQIVTGFANPHAGPATLRVVPTQMTMDMHMLGLMVGVSERVTMMVMTNYLEKEMDHITFQGGMPGTTRLGEFTTSSDGFGDTRVSALVGLWDRGFHDLQLNLGLSLPTGSNDETDQVLTPLNTRPTLRLPYPMQLGSGTFDARPGLTYRGESSLAGLPLAFGGQYMATLRLGRDEGYSLGDVHELTTWASVSPAPWISGSIRLAGQVQGRIDGQDPLITAPVQTADPDNQGGRVLDVGLGLNLLGQSGVLQGHRAAVEILLPAYRNLNGPQLETDWTLIFGWQKVIDWP